MTNILPTSCGLPQRFDMQCTPSCDWHIWVAVGILTVCHLGTQQDFVSYKHNLCRLILYFMMENAILSVRTHFVIMLVNEEDETCMLSSFLCTFRIFANWSQCWGYLGLLCVCSTHISSFNCPVRRLCPHVGQLLVFETWTQSSCQSPRCTFQDRRLLDICLMWCYT